MFEKLSTRERVLAWAVLGLVPICLLFIGIFSFIGKYNANNAQFMSLVSRVGVEEDKQAAAIKANHRRQYYRDISLPSNVVVASNDYQIWLKDLVRDKLQMELKSVTPHNVADLKYKNRFVGQSKTFTLLASASLDQLTSFLHEFYSLDLLHRINSIKIIPQSTGSSNSKKIRSGKLSLIIVVEALSLADAEVERDFTNKVRELNQTAEEFQQAILRRNIFGPANNTPTVTARPSSSYTSDTDIKISVSGSDLDADDQLNFTILESGIEGAELVVSDAKSRSASLTIPGQPAGKYEFKIGVKDNGFPPKENDKTFSVVFKDRVVVTPPPPPPPKPKFQNAGETRITGIVKDVSDQWIVWIKVRTTGERFQLKAGESFELDDKEWTIVSIEPNQATIKVDEQQLTFHPTEPFDLPRQVKEN